MCMWHTVQYVFDSHGKYSCALAHVCGKKRCHLCHGRRVISGGAPLDSRRIVGWLPSLRMMTAMMSNMSMLIIMVRNRSGMAMADADRNTITLWTTTVL